MQRLLACCPFFVVGVALPSQATLVVGPGGFPQIRDAIQAAQPGDRIDVQPGTYWNFTVTKSLSIRALQPGTVDVGFDASTPVLGPTVFAPPAGQSVDVFGVRFLASVIVFPIVHRVDVTSGRVRFDGCEIRAMGEVMRITGAEVQLQSCTLEEVNPVALGPVIRSTDSVVTVVDSQVLGATTSSFVFGGSMAAIELFGGSAHVSSSFVRGSVIAGLGGSAAIGGLVSSRAWVVDSTLQAGGGASGCVAAIPVAVGRTTVVGSGCPANLTPMPDAVGVTRPQPPAIGAPFRLDFRTEPNGFVVVFASTDSGANGIPLTEQPGMLPVAALTVAGLVLTNANGAGSIAWPIPTNPTLIGVPLWLQGVGGTSLALPLQASPVVGGRVR